MPAPSELITCPIEYTLYYPELIGVSGADIAFTMLASYEEAVMTATNEEGQALVDAFFNDDEAGMRALQALEEAVERDERCAVKIDDYVQLVLTDDESVYMENAADLLSLVDNVSMFDPAEDR